MQFTGSNGPSLGNFISNGSYSFSNPVFSSFAGYSSLALLKMLGMSTYTIIQRFRTSNFATPEDEIYKQLANRLGLSTTTSNNSTTGGSGSGSGKINVVERARNNHLNDVENILPFILMGLFYVGIRPRYDCALWHFRIFLLSRLLHTIAYQVKYSIDRFFVLSCGLFDRNHLGTITTTNTNYLMPSRLFNDSFNGNTHPSFDSILNRCRGLELTFSNL